MFRFLTMNSTGKRRAYLELLGFHDYLPGDESEQKSHYVSMMQYINPLPADKILDWSKLK